MKALKASPISALGFVLASFGAAAGVLAYAHSSHAAYNRNYTFGNAAGVYITPHGIDMIQGQLMDVLSRNKIDLSQQTLPSWEYTSPTAISLAHLPARFNQYAPALRFLRTELKDWLSNGFNVNDPRLSVQIKNAGYEIQGLRLSVRPDLMMTQGLAGNGIAVVAEVEIPAIRIHADGIRGKDLNNSFLGTFGLNKAWLELRDRRPLKITVPFRIQVMPSGGIQFETLEVSTDIADVHFEAGHDRKLMLPRIQVQVGEGPTSTLDTRSIETALLQKEPELIRVFQHHLRDFVVTELPNRLNSMAFEKLARAFDTVKAIEAPGVSPDGNPHTFDWGLRVHGLSLTEQNLSVSLDGFVADPDVTWNEGLKSAPHANPPVLTGMDATRYDFALAVSTDIVNRILYLGFQRGGFDKLDDDKDAKTQPVRMVRAPIYTPIGHGLAKMHLSLLRTPKGIQSLGVTDPFEVELDLIVRLEVGSDGSTVSMILDHIDENSASIADRFVTWDRLRSKVNTGLLEELRALNAKFAANKKVMCSGMKIPTDLFGLSLKVKQAETDDNGYLVFYMDLGNHP